MNEKLTIVLSVVVLLATAVVIAESQQSPQKTRNTQLWTTLSVNQSLFQEESTKNLMLHFTLVNDGNRVLDAGKMIDNSKLVVNGEELKDSAFIFANGPRTAEWNNLSPSGTMQFSKLLSEYFQKPGVYRISWKSSEFESLSVGFRVISK